MGQNRGEWSELYTIFYLLVNRKLKLVNENLEFITDEVFQVNTIISKKKKGDIRFEINENNIHPIIFNNTIEPIEIEDIKCIKTKLFESICKKGNVSTFNLPIVNNFFSIHNIPYLLKASSINKEDIVLNTLDNITGYLVDLGYSIKSKLGMPSTILNASRHTNFIYEVINLNLEEINKINSINTKSKIKDRISKLINCGATIKFHSVESEVFNNNLEFIDMLMPKALGEILLLSYTTGVKDLKLLFESSSIYKKSNLRTKKLEDFLLAISLGMFPSKKWDGIYSANGGIIVVSIDSEIYVLDMIYHSDKLKKYLINETKIDTPSSKRYKMADLFTKDGKIYFSLNLQIRYKK